MRRTAAIPSALVLVLALAAARAAHAQSIGFKLGGSLAEQTFEPDEDRSSVGGIAGGGFIRFGLGRAGVQLEALSIKKGSAVNDGAETTLEYIEVPLLLHLPLTMGHSFVPYLIAGPSVAFDAGCEVETPAGDPSACPDREKTDFGLSAGGGLGAAVGPGALLFEGRYTWGLKNISKETGLEVKNRAALIIVGYEIPIGRRF